MIQDHSFFVSQIADAMRPLIGVIDPAEIHLHGLDAAHYVYDQLLPLTGHQNPAAQISPCGPVTLRQTTELLRHCSGPQYA